MVYARVETKSTTNQRLLQYGLLAILVILGFGLRVAYLDRQGIGMRDEAWHAFAARGALNRIARGVPHATQPLLRFEQVSSNFSFYEDTSSNNVSGKPLFVVLLASAVWLWGRWEMLPLLGVSVAAGTLTIPAMYAAARRIGLRATGASLCALLAATMLGFVIFARLNFVHALLMLYLALALWAYAGTFRGQLSVWDAILTGLMLGFALATDPSFVIVAAAFACIELGYQVWLLRHHQRKMMWRRIAWLGIGGAVPLSLFELGYYIGHRVLPQGGVRSITGSFVGDVAHHGAEVAGSGMYGIEDLMFYPLFLVGMGGILVVLMAGLGAWSVPRRRELRFALPAILFGLIFLFAEMSPFKAGRSAVALIPLMTFMAGAGWEALSDLAKKQPRWHTGLAGLFLAAVMGYNLWADVRLLQLSSGWFAVREFFASRPQARIVVNEISDNALFAFYAGKPVILSLNPRVLKPGDYYATVGTYRPPGWEAYSRDRAVAIFANPSQVFRPLKAVGGAWTLIPWWVLDYGPPRSFLPGDDELMIFQVP